jgi:hypothetical protein
MSAPTRRARAAPVSEVLESEDVRDILRARFFVSDRSVEPEVIAQERSPTPSEPAKQSEPEGPRKHPGKERPEHYKVICISMYNEDLALLDEVVRKLKERGFTRANRSAVLRAAMQQFDPSKVARGL